MYTLHPQQTGKAAPPSPPFFNYKQLRKNFPSAFRSKANPESLQNGDHANVVSRIVKRLLRNIIVSGV